MKAFHLTMVAASVLAASTLSFSATAETSLSSIEARLLALEKQAAKSEARAVAAEEKAIAAEKKAQRLESMMNQRTAAVTSTVAPTNSASTTTPPSSNAKPTTGVSYNNEFGELKLYGDVEFNMDAASKAGKITSVRTAVNKDEPQKSDNWDINGRILIGLDGERALANGNYAGFSVQPMADMTGKMNVDDAVFYFGQKDNWEAKVGRYEAYDMFPLGQDTLVSYSGSTANDLYGDGFGYIYMMKEGRGRSGDGGSVQLNKTIDNWYFEVNALVEDGTALFDENSYHGYELNNKKNVIYVRPVVAWEQGIFKVAAAMDAQVIKNAYGSSEGMVDGKWKDMSKRNGYGLTMAWNTLEQDPDDGIVATLSSAYLDATAEKDFSVGGNILWRKAQLGYIYARNDIRDFNPEYIKNPSNDNSLNAVPGKYDLHTVFASYEIPKILDLDNYKIYLGAYYSKINADKKEMISGRDDDRYGVRARFKYLF